MMEVLRRSGVVVALALLGGPGCGTDDCHFEGGGMVFRVSVADATTGTEICDAVVTFDSTQRSSDPAPKVRGGTGGQQGTWPYGPEA
ncbi:MAG TPA: hypothetical protein VGP93_10170, partial [Polyangiaceae bacterium]|nr:hypothetical protein [Polyangiaceae bacterium]